MVDGLGRQPQELRGRWNTSKYFGRGIDYPFFVPMIGGMETPFLTFERRKEITRAWGDLLARYPWEWFVTLTFVEDVHPEAAFKKWRWWIAKLSRSLYGPRWYKKGMVFWAVAFEHQKRGVLHFHALVNGVSKARRLTWMDKWYEMDPVTGFARIEVVKSIEATSHYICKYVAK
ncbi:MAG: hypothetical protein HUJ31_00510 [Pseudomonadales bacterium]|nr:hypothetical protein [Pseudomonadales bacterium]